MVRHPLTGTVVLQLFSGELFELHDGMLEPWGNEAIRVSDGMLEPWGSEAVRECVPFAEMSLAVFGGEEMVVIGRTSYNHLYIDTRLWIHDCTSFSLHRTHLLLTTHNHTLVCVSLSQPSHVARTTDGVVDTGIRSLERGARLVISDPLSSRVVLQMPRGNLELIHPRPLLLTHLAKLIEQNEYSTVFETVRKHRVNMNFVYDYHPEQFRGNISVGKIAPLSHLKVRHTIFGHMTSSHVQIWSYDVTCYHGYHVCGTMVTMVTIVTMVTMVIT
eukprot:sb/3468103/